MSLAYPLIILAPSRSYTSVVCAMLGQHPQMYGLPEMHLFTHDTMREWWVLLGRTIYADGLLRAVAEINWGVQEEATIDLARYWLRRRLRWHTGDVFMELAQQVYPLIPVEKSPTTAYRLQNMQRVLRTFPKAKFLHLVRHPLGQGRSLVKALPQFFADVSIAANIFSELFDFSTEPPTLDPQMQWYRSNVNILNFLATVPLEQQKRVRGEDLMTDPDHQLRTIAVWMGLRADQDAVEEMKHPERSPFACIGPSNAPLGSDPEFLSSPWLRAGTSIVQSLEGPLPWLKDGAGFMTHVRDLARQFGYT